MIKSYLKNLILFILIILLFGSIPTFSEIVDQLKFQQRIEYLEKKVTELEKRITFLEQISGSNSDVKSKDLVQKDGWKDRANWRKLRKGMTDKEVKILLGEPGKIITFSFGAYWYYPDELGGRVDLDNNNFVKGWSEP